MSTQISQLSVGDLRTLELVTYNSLRVRIKIKTKNIDRIRFAFDLKLIERMLSKLS